MMYELNVVINYAVFIGIMKAPLDTTVLNSAKTLALLKIIIKYSPSNPANNCPIIFNQL